jgi:methionyl-tRNA formyltransferase
VAEELALPLLRPENPNSPEFLATLADLRPDLAVVVAYGHLLASDVLTIPPLGCVNLHASLLPRYRGAAPVPWAILAGETHSGVTLFQLDQRFDCGGVLGQAQLEIKADDTSGSYLERLAVQAADLLGESLPAIAAGRLTPRPQDESQACRAPKLTKADGLLDWQLSFPELDRRVRAFQPWPLAHATFTTSRGDISLNILRLTTASGVYPPAPPGSVLVADPATGLVVQAGDGAVRLREIHPSGKRPMSDSDFLRGTKMEGWKD